MVMLQQMIVMFLMMAVGYLCYRKQILTEEVSRKVSAIVVNVANPCMILSSALTDQQMQGKELVQTLAIVVMMYAFLLVVAQLLPRILLDVRIGVDQKICTGVTCCPLNGLYIAAGDYQLIGCTGMPQAVKDDVRKLRVRILPLLELLPNQDRFNCQTVR